MVSDKEHILCHIFFLLSKKKYRCGRCFITLLMKMQLVRIANVDIRYFTKTFRNLKDKENLTNLINWRIYNCGICYIKLEKEVATSTKRWIELKETLIKENKQN